MRETGSGKFWHACRTVAAGVLFPALAVCWGTGCARQAEIHEINVAGLGTKTPIGLICWLNLEFHQFPEAGDRRDVQVVFRSDILPEPLTFDWKHISGAPMRKLESGAGRTKLEGFSPDADPPLNLPFDIGFPMTARGDVKAIKSFTLYADLYWAGKKQDSTDIDLSYVFRGKL